MHVEDLLVELSSWVWTFLDDAADAGFTPREDTITEHLLVEMVRRAPGQVAIHKTTALEEADTGVDFAWAVEVETGRWLDLVVQAKKLDAGSNRYEELRRVRARPQAEHLVAQSRATGAAPIHLLYNGSGLAQLDDVMEVGGCVRDMLRRRPVGPPWRTISECLHGEAHGCSPAGCTVVGTYDLIALLDAGRADAPDAVAGVAAPWECLVCPFTSGGGGRPTPLGWPEVAEVDGRGGLDAPLPGVRLDPPGWAARLIEQVDPTDDPDAPRARYFAAIQRARD